MSQHYGDEYPIWLGDYANSYELEAFDLPDRGVRDGHELKDFACKLRMWGLSAYDREAVIERDDLRQAAFQARVTARRLEKATL